MLSYARQIVSPLDCYLWGQSTSLLSTKRYSAMLGCVLNRAYCSNSAVRNVIEQAGPAGSAGIRSRPLFAFVICLPES